MSQGAVVMIRRLFLMAALVSAMLAWGGSASAQGEEEYSAGFYAGRCTDIGDEVRQLDALQFGEGEQIGTPGAPRVLQSTTDDIDDVPVDELTETPHAIVILDGDTQVACGEFGGNVGHDRDEDLVFGLAPLDDSGYVGVAVVDEIGVDDNEGEDDEDDFDVTLYVVYPESLQD